MAAITDTVVTKFVAEQIRPMSEDLRDMQAEMDAINLRWVNTVSPAISANAGADTIEDNVPGGQIMTKDGAGTWISNMTAILAGLQDLSVSAVAGRRSVLEKPVVRPLKAE